MEENQKPNTEPEQSGPETNSEKTANPESTVDSGSEENIQAESRSEALADENHISDSIEKKIHVDVSSVQNILDKIQTELRKVLVGQDALVEMLMAGMLSGGHVLLEGLPGIAKTLSAKLLAKSISSKFSRIQFTPDLMPTDITGTSVFNLKDSEFYFKKGPIFANIILIDEVNRAPAKTQAALMEVMEEKQLTYDGIQYNMDYPFFVIATQNPIEQEGTYALPEAQLDRFLFKLKLTYPTLDQEVQILNRFHNDFSSSKLENIQSVVTEEELLACSKIVEQVYIKDELLDYIAALVNNTRNNGDLFLGASPRASIAILRTAKSLAAMRGRDFVTPDDIQAACTPVLNHRIILSHEREMEGTTVEEVIKDIIQTVEVPR